MENELELQPGEYVFLDETPRQQQSIGRHVARTAARAAEGALGIPGDLASVALSGVNLAHKGITGQWSPSIERAQGYLPTTENIREHGTKPLAKALGGEEYINPQSEAERVGDRFVSELTSLLTPVGVAGALGKGAKLGAKAVKGAALTAGLGNLAGWATKRYTGSELAGEAVHGLTMIGTSLGLNGSMKSHAGKIYDTTKEMGKTSHVSSHPLFKGIIDAEDSLIPKAATKGGKALSDFLEKSAKPLANRRSLSVTDLIDLNQGLNKVVSQNKGIASDARGALDTIKKAIDSSIKQVSDRKIYDMYKGADRLYSEALSASKIQDFIKKVIETTPIKHGAPAVLAASLFGIGGKYIPHLGSLIPGVAAAGGIYALGGLIKRIPGLSDPTIRRYYIQATKAAANGSRPGVIKAIHNLEKYAKGKDFKEPTYQEPLQQGEYVFID